MGNPLEYFDSQQYKRNEIKDKLKWYYSVSGKGKKFTMEDSFEGKLMEDIIRYFFGDSVEIDTF